MSFDFSVFIPSAKELGEAFSLHDFAGVPGLLLWCIIVAVPLKGVDRRDSCTGYTYILFCLTAGTILLLSLPLRLIDSSSPILHLILLIGLGTLTGIRWAVDPKKAKTNHEAVIATAKKIESKPEIVA